MLLQSIAKRKTRKFLLVGSGPVPREDLMTDCVLGCLRYFCSEQQAAALRVLFPDAFDASAIIEDVTLWPKLGDREPDAIVTGTQGAQRCAWLFEAKWGNNFLSGQQLSQQRRAFRKRYNMEGRHVAIVEDRSMVDPAVLRKAVEPSCEYTVTTWRDLVERLEQSSFSAPENGRWARDLAAFLKTALLPGFNGWTPAIAIGAPVEPQFFDQRFAWPVQRIQSTVADMTFWGAK